MQNNDAKNESLGMVSKGDKTNQKPSDIFSLKIPGIWPKHFIDAITEILARMEFETYSGPWVRNIAIKHSCDLKDFDTFLFYAQTYLCDASLLVEHYARVSMQYFEELSRPEHFLSKTYIFYVAYPLRWHFSAIQSETIDFSESFVP